MEIEGIPLKVKAGKEVVITEFSRMAEKLLEKETIEELQEKIEGREWRFYRYGYEAGRILDLGCGGGLDLLALHEMTDGQAELYGVDMTDKVLELAGERIERLGIKGVRLFKAEISSLPFDDGFFDMATIAWVLHHVDEEEFDRIFDEIRRVLRPRGTLLMLEPCEPPFTEEQWLWMELIRLQSRIELLAGRDFPRIHFTPQFTKEYLQNKGFKLEALDVITPYVGGFPMEAEFFEEELKEIREWLSKLPLELQGHFQKRLEFILKKIEMVGIEKGSTLIAKASLSQKTDGGG